MGGLSGLRSLCLAPEAVKPSTRTRLIVVGRQITVRFDAGVFGSKENVDAAESRSITCGSSGANVCDLLAIRG